MLKIKPGHIVTVPVYGYATNSQKYYERSNTYSAGVDRIEYGDGPKRNGHWPWKPCIHQQGLTFSPGGRMRWSRSNGSGTRWAQYWMCITPNQLSVDAVPTVPLSDSVIQNCMSQIDLNKSESVLLYSGVIQAIPLLGSVFSLNKVLKRVSNHISKRMRKRPFTTVIRDLIQADFIDRFVIGPTLADARRFQDATDYVLRVIQTARERNEHTFAVSATDKVVLAESTSTFRSSENISGAGELYCRRVNTRYAESKAFMLLSAKYDLNAVDPLKIWANRVGLTRPLDSIWDLVPFSFVVDYFSRAGDFISHLSDEMTSIDGLKGNITAIEDMWTTVSNVSSAYAEFTSWYRRPTLPSGQHWVETPSYDPAPCRKFQSTFVRSRVSSPWSRIAALSDHISDYLTVNLDLSSTKKRTLAELVIQAKL